MQAVEFQQQTDILAKDQPQYLPLPVHIKYEEVPTRYPGATEGDGYETINVAMEMTCCFQLSPEEIAQVVATGKIWYTQCVYGQQFQPVRMSMINPFEPIGG